ncbi:MAG: DUF1849 family protein [Alphaproteobacteria bacterium]|nr:DUF1849 family protein [Alphaproteobacteria bacterium]MBF0252127.1 DUF1849 family protein [Alphaproteobacteria bacterium]
MNRILAAMSCALTFATATPMVGWAGEIDLASFRAIYDIRLAQAHGGAGVGAVTGRIVYGVEKTCDAWIINQTGLMRLQMLEGDTLDQPLNFSSWEADDGAHYRFSVPADGDHDEAILGSADMKPTGGTVVFTRPSAEIFDLPAGTVFPVQHTRHVIEQARAGTRQFQNTIFEGTDVEGAKLLVTFISPLAKGVRAAVKKALGESVDPALDHPGWNFRMAYFDPANRTGEPLYEIEADYLDNGVPLRWLLDYGPYSVEMILGGFETLPPPEC